MSSFKIRPRVKVEVNKPYTEICEIFKSKLESNSNIVGTVANKFIILKIPQEQRHFWSPQLTIMLEEYNNNTIVRGLYGPKQSVWAMFAFAYGSFAMLFSIFFIWASVEWQLNNDTSLYYYLPIFVILGIITYIFAQFGQKLGAEQMFKIHHFFQEIIEKDVNVE
jgi:hypothetical protein